MSERVKLDVKAEILPGDFGRDYVRVTIGEVEVSVYESETRPGGVTVEVDADLMTDVCLLRVHVNDGEVFPGE